MNRYQLLAGLLFLTFSIFVSGSAFAQITSDATEKVPTEYSNGPQDNIYIFCGAKGEKNASLTATSPNGESGSFEWGKYNIQSGDFDLFPGGSADISSSTISNLEDGCYRVKITTTSGELTSTAWVFNNFIDAKAEITGSDCNSFTLNGTFEKADFSYTDLTNEQTKVLSNTYKVKWTAGSVVVGMFATTKIYEPPTTDTDYNLEVTDRFGCVGKADVRYISIVTKASFTYKEELQGPQKDKRSDARKNEAPLTVTFTNTSENGDPGKYEWYIFKDLFKIGREVAAKTFKDSILEILTNDNPVYTFEEIGQYKVKLVSKKITNLGNETITCTDTFYMSGYIVADSSFIDAPNVFTPDGNGVNDKFVVKFFSMKSVKITIVNRWGKVVHTWESNNVRGFVNTAEGVTE